MYIATLMESFAVVTSGPELMAGSMPTFLNKKGRNRPSVVATIMAENIAIAKAKMMRIGSMLSVIDLGPSRSPQPTPPMIPQQRATNNATRTSRINTWLNLCAARWPVAKPQTTMADVCSPALPLMAAIIGTNRREYEDVVRTYMASPEHSHDVEPLLRRYLGSHKP